MAFPGHPDSKESTWNAEDLSSIPGLGRSPGGGHGNPLQYSCLKNPMIRGVWQTTVHNDKFHACHSCLGESKSPYRSLNWGLSPVTGILTKRPQLGIYHTASSRNVVSGRLLGAHDQQIYQPFLIPVVE